MSKRRRGNKKRQFFALLQSASSVEQKAILLSKKCSRAQAEAQIRAITNSSWDILLIMARNAYVGAFTDTRTRQYFRLIKTKIKAGHLTTI